jgi:D-sedoheptulose 7-phosphate isomerase
VRESILGALDKHRLVAEALLASFADPIEQAARRLIECYRAGGKLLVMGNGGSAADAQHFAAELVGRYMLERPAYPAIALSTDTSILTAVSNDYGYADVFRRQVEAHARPGDVVVGISTSGNSENVCRAMVAAKERGAVTIALGGGDGGKMKSLADISLIAPSKETPRIQEAHITIIHILCDVVEAALAGHDAR